jgi:hypothetical protein
MDLSGLECWVGEEGVDPGYFSAVVDDVATSRARIAKHLTMGEVRPRIRNVVCPNIGAMYSTRL